MRVKICGIRNEADLDAVAKSGADAAGFLLGQIHPSPDFILPGTAARLVREMPPFLTPVIVTHLSDPEEVFDLVLRTGITTVQLHGGVTPDQAGKLRDMLPPSGKIILAVHFREERDFVDCMEFYRIVSSFLIDSVNETTGQVGGTGLTNDWDLAARFVRTCPAPVILAGGLNSGNVAAAVRTAAPYGVDANTGMKTPGGNIDPAKCLEFVRAARGEKITE